MAERRITRAVSEENRFDYGKVASSDLATVTNLSIDHLFQMFDIDFLQNEEFEIESIAALSNFDRSDFHQLSKNFLFHSMRKQVHLLLESNVRHENEERIFSIP